MIIVSIHRIPLHRGWNVAIHVMDLDYGWTNIKQCVVVLNKIMQILQRVILDCIIQT